MKLKLERNLDITQAVLQYRVPYTHIARDHEISDVRSRRIVMDTVRRAFRYLFQSQVPHSAVEQFIGGILRLPNREAVTAIVCETVRRNYAEDQNG